MQKNGQSDESPESAENHSSERVFIEAIARKRMVVAQYNGGELHLAPHLLFSRHGELFVSAVNARKKRREDEEAQLGQFKLLGLSNASVTEEPFEPLTGFSDEVPRDGDERIFSVGG